MNGQAPGATRLSAGDVRPSRAPDLPAPDTEWLHHRGDAGSMNYSPLAQINRDNLTRLRVAWRWKSHNFGSSIYPNLEVTPLMANGVIYATAGASRSVVAIDARTGETLWMYRLDEGARGEIAPRKGPGRGLGAVAPRWPRHAVHDHPRATSSWRWMPRRAGPSRVSARTASST
ncbi:MAG: PQQ-binding-like beta-propeller repeat protein [Proteobacteria bacterium]|nr:PQQ-binding-like beta-propeller repeat protein [Pseudomonadota bacterium]